jgi:hypothetical protein
MERYRLLPLDTGAVGPERRGAKRGYCFFDGLLVAPDLPRARARPFYTFESCGEADWLSVRVGLSVGWGDIYPWHYAGQYIDLVGVPDGMYLVCLTADPDDAFDETFERDNDSWALIRLSDTAASVPVLEVLERGGTSCRRELRARRA